MEAREEHVFRHTAGWWMMLTLPVFLITGMALMALSFSVARSEIVRVGPASLMFGAGLLLTIGGALLSFRREEKRIHRAMREVTDRHGWFGFFRSRTYSLDRFQRVAVVRGRIASQSGDAQPRFKLYLAGDEAAVYLAEMSSGRAAVKKAREVADFVGLPVVDLSAEAQIAETLASAPQPAIRWPDAPGDARCQSATSGQWLLAEIPAAGFRLRHVPLLLLAGVSYFVCFRFLYLAIVPDDALVWQQVLYGGLAPLFLVLGTVCLAWMAAEMSRRETVVATADGVSVETSDWFGRRQQLIWNHMIKEVDIDEHEKILRIDCPKARLELGGGLASDERGWLSDAIAAAVKARQGQAAKSA